MILSCYGKKMGAFALFHPLIKKQLTNENLIETNLKQKILTTPMHPTQTDLSKINTRQLFQLTIDVAHTLDFCEKVNLIKKSSVLVVVICIGLYPKSCIFSTI